MRDDDQLCDPPARAGARDEFAWRHELLEAEQTETETIGFASAAKSNFLGFVLVVAVVVVAFGIFAHFYLHLENKILRVIVRALRGANLSD
jgi:hypothetical protein